MRSYPYPDTLLRRTLCALAVAVIAGAGLIGCAPSEEEPGPSAAELEQFREEVTQALEAVRTELRDLQDRVAEEAPEEWSYLSTVAEMTQEEVMSDLERLATASEEEAERVRRTAATRLAELEAEVIKREVDTAEDPAALRAAMDEHLSALSSNLAAVADRVVADTPDEEAYLEREATRTPGTELAEWGRDQSTPERIAELEDEIEVMREWAEKVTEISEEEEEEFVTLRGDMSEGLGELTRKVRALWYSTRWTATTV